MDEIKLKDIVVEERNGIKNIEDLINQNFHIQN